MKLIRRSAVTIRETREREKCDIKENKTKNLKRKKYILYNKERNFDPPGFKLAT